MALRIQCPHCSTQLQVADEHRSKQVRCPVCSTIMTVPASAAPPPAPSAVPALPTIPATSIQVVASNNQLKVERSSTFRDFGILPENLEPPPAKVLSYFSPGRIVGQYTGTALVSGLGVGLMVLCALILPAPLRLLGCAAALIGFAVFVFLGTQSAYRWIELEGTTLRAKHLYTGRMIERSVDEIESLDTILVTQTENLAAAGLLFKLLYTFLVDKLLGRVKGAEIRFRDRRTPLRITRTDPAMSNAEELIKGVLYRMKQLRELDAEIIDLEGRPLVRNVHWKGETPWVPSRKTFKPSCVVLILLALAFGPALGLWAQQEQERVVVVSAPPRELSLSSLIQNGPGTNRHLTVTDFQPGGYAAQGESGSWKKVWIAIFPPGMQGNKIQAVLWSSAVRDEAALQRLLQPGRVTGICSETPTDRWETDRWGTDVTSVLEKANQARLLSAWSIEETSEPPSAALVTATLTGSAACFAAVFVLAALVFGKGN